MLTNRFPRAPKSALKTSFHRLIIIAASSAVLITHPAKAGPNKYVVANAAPPDAFLSLRTDPSAASGRRLETMPNGTPLEVTEKRPDGWWHVRDLNTGQTGWALSASKTTTWIAEQPSHATTSHGDPAQIVHQALDPIFQKKAGAEDDESRYLTPAVKLRADAFFSVEDNARSFDSDLLLGMQDWSDMTPVFLRLVAVNPSLLPAHIADTQLAPFPLPLVSPRIDG